MRQLPFCSDFRRKSNRIFMLGVVFFFKQILIFLPAILTDFFKYHWKGIVVNFSKSYGGLKGAILANLEQLTHDIFHAIN